jgi:hypothetical protein
VALSKDAMQPLRRWARLLHQRLHMPLPQQGAGRFAGATDSSAEVVSYVLTGKPPHAPALLQADAGSRWRLRLQLSAYDTFEGIPDIYDGFGDIPADVALRWARLLETDTTHHHCALVFAGGRRWPELLLINDAHSSVVPWLMKPRRSTLEASTLERLLVRDGLPAHAALVAAFDAVAVARTSARKWVGQRGLLVRDMPGYGPWLARHVEAVRPCLARQGELHALHVFEMLTKADDVALHALQAEICMLAVSSGAVLGAASEVLRRCGDIGIKGMGAIAVRGTESQRLNALRWLAETALAQSDEALAANVRSAIAADPSPCVQALALATEPDANLAEALSHTVPAPVSAAVCCDSLGDVVGSFWAGVRQAWDANASRTHPKPAQGAGPFVAAECDALLNYLVADTWVSPGQFSPQAPFERVDYTYQPLMALAAHPQATAAIVLKTLLFLYGPKLRSDRLETLASAFVAMYRERQSRRRPNRQPTPRAICGASRQAKARHHERPNA